MSAPRGGLFALCCTLAFASAAPAEEPYRIGPFVLGEITTTITFEDTALPNPAGFGPEPLIAWRVARADVDVAALLAGDMRVRRLVIEDARIRLIRSADGAWNIAAWRHQMRAEPVADAAAAVPDPAADAAPVAPQPGGTFAVDELVMTGATVTFADETVADGPAVMTFDDLALTVRNLAAPMPPEELRTTVDLRAHWAGAEGGVLTVKGRGNFLSEEKSFQLRLAVANAPATAFKPYYVRRTLDIRGGVVDADVDATCERNVLNAKVAVTIHDLDVRQARTGIAGRVYNVTTAQFVQLVQARGGDFNVQFGVEGDLDDPEFAMDATAARLFAQAAANTLASTMESMARAGQRVGRELRGLTGTLLGK